jgi:hypothetical protein
MTTFTTNLRLTQPALSATGWGTTVNNGITALVDVAVSGVETVDVTAGNVSMTIDDGAQSVNDARNMFIVVGGTLPANRTVTVPTNSKLYFVHNNTSGAYTLSFQATAGVLVPQGKKVPLYSDGTDILYAFDHLGSLTLGTALAATSGGTGQSSYAVGDLLYAGTTTTLAKLASVATGNVLRAGGVGTAPAWGKADLTTDVTGTLPAANGGTGLSSPGANGNVLRSDGAGNWVSGTLASATTSAEGLVELATDAEVRTGTDTTRAITPDALRKGALVFEAGTFPTSGTVVDFTDIPSWVQRITIMFDGLSTSGSDAVIVQLGASGGIEDSGYTSVSSYGGSVGNYSSSTRGFIIDPGNSVGAAQARRGAITLVNIYSSRWVCSGAVSGSNVTGAISGSKLISGGTLTQLRITTDTASPTNTFDAGLVNIMYE